MLENPAYDLLSRILSQYRLRAEVFASPSVCGNWRLNTAGLHRAGFHLVRSGGCWLHLKEDEPRWLAAGDLVFLPGDDWHVLAPQRELDDDTTALITEGHGPVTELTCGSIQFEDRAGETLLDALAGPVVLCAAEEGNSQAQQSLALLLGIEAGESGPGRQAVLDRLAEVVFVHVLRHVIDAGLASTGLLAGLRDRQLRRALSAIHGDWRRHWQLEDLAEEAGLARSTFARRFQKLVGQTPIQYVSAWRMWQAETLLAGGTRSVAEVAEQLDYASEAAFRRAFTRVRGVPPGRIRRISGFARKPEMDS